MPKRRRLILKSPMKNKPNADQRDDGMTSARGRFKGALLDQLEPTDEESEASPEKAIDRSDRSLSNDIDSEDRAPKTPRITDPARQSYVLKLFDRSVDLSQFRDNSPLYPICRAWIANQPKADYNTYNKTNDEETEESNITEEQIELPGPKGPLVSRIPELLPEQLATDKDKINLVYTDSPLPSRSELISSHMGRWTQVRRAWIQQANKAEERYKESQDILNRISVCGSP